MRHYRLGLLVLAATSLTTSLVVAQERSIHTGGSGGAYNSLFCPPLPKALEAIYFHGRCTPSGGTIDNFNKVLNRPTDIGFGQQDVLLRVGQERPDDFKKVSIIRDDIACEGLWMVTKNERLSSFGDVLGLGRRIPFLVPGNPDPAKASGTQRTWDFIKSLDPEGIGRAQNVKFVESATSAINNVAASTDGSVAFFVQFADPESSNFKLIREKKLKVIPVVSKQILDAKVGDRSVYRAEEFQLSTGFFTGESKLTSCTPVVLFTGAPDGAIADDQKDLITRLSRVEREKMLPQESRTAALLRNAKRWGGSALEEVTAGVELARQKMEKSLQ
jgi:hypothetical protein